MSPETAVIIPNRNGLQHLRECLSSLQAQTYEDFIVIFVDDYSTDDSVNFVKQHFPLVDIILLTVNNGPVKAINEGIQYAFKKYNPRYVALLNNDTVTDPGWLSRLTDKIESEKNIFAVTSNIKFYKQPELINSQGGTCNIIGEGYDINIFKKESEIKEIPCEVLYPSGGANLIKVSLLKITGLLDERYFNYCEDLDLGWRARLYGYKSVLCEQAIVFHKYSAYWKNYPAEKEYFNKRNALCTIIKYYNAINLMKAMCFLFWNYAAYPFWALFNVKGGLMKKLQYTIIPLKSIFWNLKNISRTLNMRANIQKQRKVDDKEIIEYMNRH